MATSLNNVAVFAGGFCFGSILAIAPDTPNADMIETLLAVAFLLFATSLFISIGVIYILRTEKNEDEHPEKRWKSDISVIHTAIVIVLLIGGFAVLDAVLIIIEQKVCGIIGIALLGMIPIWYVTISMNEDWLEKADAQGRNILHRRNQREGVIDTSFNPTVKD
jgi:amino acid transporter